MAMYTMLQSGSRGEDVKKMQQALESAGYSVGSAGIDGIYGPDTAAAVRRYQQAKKLQVDGIAGDETLGSLYGSDPAEDTPASPVPDPAVPGYSAEGYDPDGDAAYMQALAALGQLGTAPQYSGSYDGELEELYRQIAEREPFRYDPDGDALYQQYARQYAGQGRLAMLDTMGQASALTGGYSSSYAQTAGQQQYGAYLQQLGSVLPELYGMALDRYESQGAALEDRYALLAGQAREEYSRYQDALAAYQKEAAQRRQAVQDAYDQGYSAYKAGQTAREEAYDRLAELISSTGYTPTAAELAAAGMTAEQARAYAKQHKDN